MMNIFAIHLPQQHIFVYHAIILLNSSSSDLDIYSMLHIEGIENVILSMLSYQTPEQLSPALYHCWQPQANNWNLEQPVIIGG